MVRKAFILENQKIKDIGREFRKVAAALKRAGVAVQDQPGPETDLIVTLGGDGTLLKGVHAARGDRTLVFGVKYGKVGFLTNPAGNLESRLRRICRSEAPVSERLLLHAQARREKRVVLEDYCLNEAAFFRAGIRIVTITVRHEAKTVLKVRADGLIVATPTGSTAHAFAAGGPIVHPEMEAILILPVCPYSAAARPVLLPADGTVEVTVNSECRLALDGQREAPIKPGDTVIIGRHRRKARLVIDEPVDFFGKMQDKFSWPL